MTRSIIVSNQDAQIHYEGEWFPINSSIFQNLGNFGPPLEGIYHTTSNGSFSFSFSGSFINVFALVPDSPPDGPDVECFIDGISINSSVGTGLNNADQCSMTLPDGPHELTLNISTQGWPYYLDAIGYTPSVNISTNNAVVLVGNADPSITFSPGWSQIGPLPTNLTQTTNAFLNISFIGIRIEWLGLILGIEPHIPSPAEYSVDNGPLIPFTLGLPPNISNSSLFFNVPFLITDVLQQGPHTLFVRFLGNESTSPLTLNGFLVTNASDPVTMTMSSRSISTTSASSTPPLTRVNKHGTPNLNGAAIGGFVLIGFGVVGLLVLYYRRLKHRKLKVRSNPRSHFGLDLSSAASDVFPSAAGEVELRQDRTASAPATPAVPTVERNNILLSQTSPYISTLPTTLFAQISVSGASELPSVNSNLELTTISRAHHHEGSGLHIMSPGFNNALELPPDYSSL